MQILNVLCLPSRLHCCNSAAVDMTSADKQLHLDERQNAIARKMRKAEPDATAKFLKRTRRCPDDDFRSLLAPAAASDNDDPSRAEAVFFDCWSAPPAHRIHQVASDLQYNCEKRNVLLTKAQPRLVGESLWGLGPVLKGLWLAAAGGLQAVGPWSFLERMHIGTLVDIISQLLVRSLPPFAAVLLLFSLRSSS